MLVKPEGSGPVEDLKVPVTPQKRISKAAMAIVAGGLLVALTAGPGYNALSSFQGGNLGFSGFFKPATKPGEFAEGPCKQIVVEAGPFDIKRKYKSMEGPFIGGSFVVSDLVASKKISLPESAVGYVELGGLAPSMNGGGAPAPYKDTDVQGLIHNPDKDALYWIKGIKLEVLDEQGKIMPDAEFICHFNWNNDPEYHNKRFPDATHTVNSRLFSITQGQTEIFLPNGFGIPAAGDEVWNLWYQAANRTTTEHRRLKHRCTLYVIKDSDLLNPIQAVHEKLPTMGLVTDRNFPDLTTEYKKVCPACSGTSSGVNAPNDVLGGVYGDSTGRRYTGHWVIPPGEHTYTCVVNDLETPDFANPKDDLEPSIHLVWSHVHPLCTDFSLYEIKDSSKRLVLSAKTQTKTEHGLQIKNVDLISSEKGILLHPIGAKYELEQSYNNTTGEPLDSMGTMGVFFTDKKFIRPTWSLPQHQVISCMSKPGTGDVQDVQKPVASKAAVAKANAILRSPFPLLTAKNSTPLLTKPVQFELNTFDGPIDVELNPALAPKTATYMANLMLKGALNSTRIYDFKSNFLMSVARPDDKITRNLDDLVLAHTMMRRLPLEIARGAVHKKYALTMSKEAAPDSAIGSFSVLLIDAPHMDGKYCVFGNLIPNAKTLSTLANIEKNWNDKKGVIMSVTKI
jgi:cyclophilin family peptidyl-prolyl cis-trans isomerase